MRVNKRKDLKSVCLNFQLVLYSKIDGDTYNIDELKSKIEFNTKS